MFTFLRSTLYFCRFPLSICTWGPRALSFLERTRGLHSVSGPGVSVCKSRYDIVIWRAENRTHLSKQTRPSTERSRKASNVRGIPSRPDDQLRWVLIVHTQVYDMGGELPYSQTSRLNHTIDYLVTLTYT